MENSSSLQVGNSTDYRRRSASPFSKREPTRLSGEIRARTGRASKLKLTLWLVLVIFFVGALGCASQERKKGEALHHDVRTYGKALRWGYYDQAAVYLRSRDESTTEIDRDALEDIRVTSYEIVRVEFKDGDEEAAVTAIIDYYNERVNVVKTIQDKQKWWYDPETEKWGLDGALPDFQ